MVLQTIRFPLLFMVNSCGIIAIALKAQVFSAMKALYFLNSLPSFAAFVGFGVDFCESYRFVRWSLTVFFCCLFVLVALHIVHIAASLSFVMGK